MKKTQLGFSDLYVSEIGFGCMSLGNDHTDNERILHRAMEFGINLFDTADLYEKGMNEISVGKAFMGKRDKVILATKVGNQWRADGSGWDWNPGKEYILSSVEESLKRLQTDYIDLYQLHGGTIDDPIEETLEAFELLKKQGKIRYYGISSIRPNVIREYVKLSSITSVMMQYSLLDRRPEEESLNLLKEKNISVLVRGAVAQGLLIDKEAKEYLQYSREEVSNASSSIGIVSGKQRNKAQTAIRFVLQHPAISSVIAGIRTMDQLEDAVKTSATPELSDDEMKVLKDSVKANKYQQHR